MRHHIGSSKIHSKLNNTMISKSQVILWVILWFTMFYWFLWKFCSIFQEKAQVFQTNIYVYIHKYI